MKVVIPMAGRGSRFLAEAHRNSEYSNPKPLIPIAGHPMVKWAVGSFPHPEYLELIFLVLKEHIENFQIDTRLKELFSDNIKIVVVDQVTEGAACTVLLAKEHINDSEPIIISDSDHFFDGKILSDAIMSYGNDVDGLIPVFSAEGPKWSYSKEGDDGLVVQVAEKVQISSDANIGAYYFRSGKEFVNAAEEMIRDDARVNNEFYIAPVYNYLIKKNMRIRLVRPGFVYGLGTPVDAENFIKLVSKGTVETPHYLRP